MILAINRHKDSWIDLDQLGRHIPPYQPTYDYGHPYINANHRYYSECPIDGEKIVTEIQGSLRREDALKLYEMAYFSDGDIVELGCNRGLSTSIMSRANHDSGFHNSIYTVDLMEKYSAHARTNLKKAGLLQNVHFHTNDGTSFLDELLHAGKSFAFAFIDHSHQYVHVYEAAKRMKNLIKDGGFVLFHDYNDWRNSAPDQEDYGVAQAAIDGLGDDFEFYGIYGCTALFRKV